MEETTDLFEKTFNYLFEEKPIKYTVRNNLNMVKECAACELDGNYVGDCYNYESRDGGITYIRKLYKFEEPPKDADTLISCLDDKVFLSARDIILRLGCKEYYNKAKSKSTISLDISNTLQKDTRVEACQFIKGTDEPYVNFLYNDDLRKDLNTYSLILTRKGKELVGKANKGDTTWKFRLKK